MLELQIMVIEFDVSNAETDIGKNMLKLFQFLSFYTNPVCLNHGLSFQSSYPAVNSP